MTIDVVSGLRTMSGTLSSAIIQLYLHGPRLVEDGSWFFARESRKEG